MKPKRKNKNTGAESEIITINMTEADDGDTVCHICDAEFLDAEDLKIHITQIHLTESSSSRFCYFCSTLFSDVEGLAIHIRDKHLSDIRCCMYCSRAYLDSDKLRRHQSKHVNTKKGVFNCSHCPTRFINLYQLELHECNHNDYEDGFMLHNIYPHLSSHINIKAETFLQTLNAESFYTCVICEYSNKDVKKYLNHIKTKKCQSLACNNCSNVYKKKYSIKNHILSGKHCYNHVTKDERNEKCPECHENIPAAIFKHHLKTCKPIKCSTCDMLFNSMYELSEHQSKKHPLSVLLTKCKYCHREYVGALNLKKHMERQHKNDKHLYKYKCVHCDQYFKHPKLLFAHFFIRHRDVEPYTCKICDTKFRIRKKFTIHIKMKHNSVGRVEFDESFHVNFTNEKPVEVKEKEKDDSDANEQMETAEETAEENYIVAVDTDLAQTEGNTTEVEQTEKRLKRKRKLPKKEPVSENENNVLTSDEEPLINIQKRGKIPAQKLRQVTWNRKKRIIVMENKKKFTCEICKKYCYTFQNYHHHISLHYKNESKKCIKCSKTFLSEEDLNNHITKEHSSSKLTETLKSMLEKRKRGLPITNQPELSNAEKFLKTIRKVDVQNDEVTAKLSSVEKDVLSVQKFIENFTPETEAKKETPVIENSISIKEVCGIRRPPIIKMTKFQSKPEKTNQRLRMPVKFSATNEYHTATLKVVQTPIPDYSKYVEESYQDDYAINYESQENKDDNIPEVAQEVMLEGTIEVMNKVPRKIVIPRMPQGFDDVRIAHLQREAPYYKIVKVNDMLDQSKEEEPQETITNNIVLPDGTKLVNVNPLAHLLGDKQIETLGKIQNRYYKPKKKNFEAAITKALLTLNASGSPKKRSGRRKVVVEQ